MRTLLTLIAVLGLVGPAAAGTKFKTNLVPTPADCFDGLGVCLNNGFSCLDVPGNSDCMASGLSPKSTVSLDGKGKLTVQVKGVRDATGALVSTGPVGSSDTYVLDLEVRACAVNAGEIPYCSSPNAPGSHLYVKVPLTNGNGLAKVDLHPVITGALAFGAGQTLHVRRVSLVAQQPFCMGTNSAADITARLVAGGCNAGDSVVAVDGLSVE